MRARRPFLSQQLGAAALALDDERFRDGSQAIRRIEPWPTCWVRPLPRAGYLPERVGCRSRRKALCENPLARPARTVDEFDLMKKAFLAALVRTNQWAPPVKWSGRGDTVGERMGSTSTVGGKAGPLQPKAKWRPWGVVNVKNASPRVAVEVLVNAGQNGRWHVTGGGPRLALRQSWEHVKTDGKDWQGCVQVQSQWASTAGGVTCDLEGLAVLFIRARNCCGGRVAP